MHTAVKYKPYFCKASKNVRLKTCAPTYCESHDECFYSATTEHKLYFAMFFSNPHNHYRPTLTFMSTILRLSITAITVVIQFL